MIPTQQKPEATGSAKEHAIRSDGADACVFSLLRLTS